MKEALRRKDKDPYWPDATFEDDLTNSLDVLVDHGLDTTKQSVREGIEYVIETVAGGRELDDEMVEFMDRLFKAQHRHGSVITPPEQTMKTIEGTRLYDCLTNHMRDRKVKQLQLGKE